MFKSMSKWLAFCVTFLSRCASGKGVNRIYIKIPDIFLIGSFQENIQVLWHILDPTMQTTMRSIVT